MKFLHGILLTVLALGAVAWGQSINKIHPDLQKTLQRDGQANIMVSMKGRTKDILDKIKAMAFPTRAERFKTLYAELTKLARNSQRKTLLNLATPSILKKYLFGVVESLWISNEIVIKLATAEFVDYLTTFGDISLIKKEGIVHLIKPTESQQASIESTVQNNVQWGVRRTGAPDVWARGFNGSNIKIGVIDTGANYKHRDIKNAIVNDGHNWFDATKFVAIPELLLGLLPGFLFGLLPPSLTSQPYDDQGHGTHVMGTAAGRNGIGVAPGATAMACKALDLLGTGLESQLKKCFQFMLCPTTPYGEDPDFDKAPHVISNSWGYTGHSDAYKECTDACEAVGIAVIFAGGNDGNNGCATTGSPADYANVFTVGSIGLNDAVSDFSSRGATGDGQIKPDFVAPGDNILSASNTDNNGNKTMSGTSMSTPHV